MPSLSGQAINTGSIKQHHARTGLANPVAGARTDITSVVGRFAIYAAGDAQPNGSTTPLLLIHSINAAGSAYEVKPLYDYYARQRPVYAIDLPGFGQSDRDDREYTARMMTDAVHAAVEQIRRIHGEQPIDALALSLASEFLARAAIETPQAFRSLGFISPTGFEGRARDDRTPGTRGRSWIIDVLRVKLWDRGFFKMLTARPVIRKFLEKAWGSKDIDEPMVDYDYATTHQPGARHAPYYFVAGFMFSTDILHVYEQLRLPVWMAHGVRGDFVDYRHKSRVAGRSNWTIVQFDTGAFPHFEVLDQVVSSYNQFLTKVQPSEVGKPTLVQSA
ncbi:alpha/beta fold hydrolase [Rhodopseudomonas palustris]